MRWVALLTLTLLLSLGARGAAPRIDIARFSQGDLAGWQERSFRGRTDYRLVRMEAGTVLQARSDASASGLYRQVEVDLTQTPVLHWSWKTDALMQGNDERTRAGDDYPARIYVVFSGGAFFWRTRAINYVWSSHQPQGSQWPNAFTGNARMIVVSAGQQGLGEWQHLQRDVWADYRRLFGSDPGRVDAVAIMTDTDNTGQRATAWYGDIWFSTR
ncbi:MAG TPA: DUF3047 domain-containing protein [Lysobacter sp.]|nr:DUF3047 domain-containing protein [Lysobacter sp.]